MSNSVCLFVSTEEFDPVSALIRARTECDWSHVGFYRLASNVTFSAMCDGKGVAWRALRPMQKIMLLDAPHVDEAFSYALTQSGKPYNTIDIAGLAVGRNWETVDSFICSTLVLWAFEKAEYPLLNPTFIPLEHYTPRDILLSPYVQERKP